MRKFDTINVIPFIDIMLVLLAIVLTTATFVASGQLDIALPDADGKASTETVQPLEIAIDRELQHYVDGAETTVGALSKTLDDTPPATPITLVIDERVPFGKFVTVIDLLKDRSLDKIAIRTRKAH